MAKRDIPPKVKPPKDWKQFWIAPHCGPGTLNIEEVCGYCGASHRECASAHSDFLARASEEDLLRHADIDQEIVCIGSGFWCSGCGRFWAQDSCGNSEGSDWNSADGVRLESRGEWVYCVCGKRVMHETIEED